MSAAEALEVLDVESVLASARAASLEANIAALYRLAGLDGWLEIQALEVPGSRGPITLVGHARDAAEAARLASSADSRGGVGVYLIPAEIEDGASTRLDSRGKLAIALKGKATTSADVVRRRVILIDVDPERARGTSATESERAAASAVASRVLRWLAARVPRNAIAVGDSGNGFALFVAIDAPNAPEVEKAIRGLLEGLAARFAAPGAKIDRAVHDAKRLTFCPGTTKRKGAAGISERPHRRTCLAVPAHVERLELADLERLARELAPEDEEAAPVSSERQSTGDGPFKRAKEVPVREVATWLGLESADGIRCPGCGEVQGTAIVGNGFKCSHDRCSSKGYAAGFRTTVDLVTEVRRVDAVSAVKLLAERFGFEAFRTPYEAAERAAIKAEGAAPPARRFASAITAPDEWPEVEVPVEWLVPALRLAVGRPALFNGPGSIGKTLVAQYVATCLLGGVEGLGGLVAAGPPRRVVHIDGDQGVAASRRRYRRLAGVLGVSQRPTLVSLLHAMAEAFDPANVVDWSTLLRGHDLAIIDSLSSLVSVAGLDENSASDTKKILAALLAASEETHCAIVLISHTGHDADDGKGNTSQRKRPRGSSAIIQGAGSIWTFTGGTERGAVRTATLERESEQDDGSELVTSWQFAIVARNDTDTPGMPGVPGLEIQQVVQQDADEDERERERRAAIARKLIDVVREQRHHTSRDTVVRAAGVKTDHGRTVLAELLGRAVIVKDKEGRFRLASELEEEDPD